MERNIWKRFIKGDEAVLTKLAPEIADSWKNCYQHKINPYLKKPQKIITTNELKNRQWKNKLLIALVKKEIKQLKALASVQQPLFVLTDQEGAILWRDGNSQVKSYANDIYFHEGSRWGELDVGTNAIGLVLQSRKPEVIASEDHYAAASRKWSCAASPIVDSEEEIVGVLDISTYSNDSVKEVTLFLNVLTQQISNQLIKAELQQRMELLAYASEHLGEGILCDTHYKVMYLPNEVPQDIQLHDDIRLFLSKERCYEKEEILMEGDLIGYLFRPLTPARKNTSFYYDGVPTKNEHYQQFLEQAWKLAQSAIPVHIYGESGSGKEVIARLIHYSSAAKAGPLVVVNCGAVSENLLESELFGYAPGAFTGADPHGYGGKIRAAHQGTLFLDEIDSMPVKMQTALLRVLEEKRVTPLNGSPQEVDFRLVTASNQDLRKKVLAGDFREDLFYRIYVGKLEIPPLRQRLEDLEPLVDAFCQERDWHIQWKQAILEVAKEYTWSGNIREFRNFLERLFIYYSDRQPTTAELREVICSGSLEQQAHPLIGDPRVEIQQALKAEHYHMTNAAKRLGISRATLYRKIKEYQISY